MIVTVAALNWARAYVNNATFQLCALYVCGLAYVGICMQGVFSIYVAHANKQIEEAVKYEQQLKDLQKQHYDMLLEREGDKRAHGLGLLNVRETVETMGGRLEIRKEDNTFCAIVTI